MANEMQMLDSRQDNQDGQQQRPQQQAPQQQSGGAPEFHDDIPW